MAKATPSTTKPASTKTERNTARDQGLVERITKMRDAGKKWSEIAEEVGKTVGATWMLHRAATIPAKLKVKGFAAMNAKDQTAAVRELRDNQKLSWGEISARTGVGEGTLRKLYDADTRGVGNRIGKGGRQPSGVATTPKPGKTAAAKAPSAGGARVATGKAKSGVQTVATKKSNAARPSPSRTKAPVATEGGVQKTPARRTQGRARVRSKSAAAS